MADPSTSNLDPEVIKKSKVEPLANHPLVGYSCICKLGSL